jgi:proteasome assembly chaperone (PAC2) family protein
VGIPVGVYVRFKRRVDPGKPLVVGLPGMGRVGYIVANYLLEKLGGLEVAEVYSIFFPPQLVIGEDAVGGLFTGRIYDTGKALIFTADTQPQSPEGQNAVSKKVIEVLARRGLTLVLAAAAYVVPHVGRERRVYVVGTDRETLERFTSMGAIALRGGVISGINGIIVGWGRYYGIPGAVLLGETWAPIVEVGEADFRAAKYVVNLIGKFLSVELDLSELDEYAVNVEKRIEAAMARAVSRQEEEERSRYRPSTEVM